MRKLDDKAFSNLVPIVLAVIITFAVLFIGAFVNAQINDALTETYPDNTKTGSVNTDTWYNVSTNETVTVTLSSPNTASKLDGTTSRLYIRANGTFPIYYNLTVNNITVNTTSQLVAGEGYNHTITALIAGGSVTGANTTITFQWDVNSTESNTQIRIYGTYYATGDLRTNLENNTVNTMNNISGNWDTSIDIVQVVIIITILAAAIGAIFMFTRFGGR